MSTATPPLLDLESLLSPIAADSPSGESLTYAPEYDELREARRAEDEYNPDDPWSRPTKSADWERVIELGSECLRDQTKDLQIAAWLTEALIHLHGFAGLRDGLQLIREIQERFWETYFPELDEDDPEARAGPFLFLNTTLPPLVRSVPVTAASALEGYSWFRWKESRDTENVGLKDPELKEALVAEGKITAEQFDHAVAPTPRRFFETLVEDLRLAWEAYRALDQSNDERFGRYSPGFVDLRKAMEDVRKLVEPILTTKRQQEPDAELDAPPEKSVASEESATPEAWEASPTPETSAPRTAAAGAAGPIADAEDARRRIAAAAEFLRRDDPGNPVPYLVVRALRMGEVYTLGQPPDPTDLNPPASETRQTLKRLMAEGEWNDLLAQCEQALARPEGRGWLDPQRYALAALAAVDHEAAAAATRSLLRAFLSDFPDLPQSELADDTPAANSETRAWLKAEVLLPKSPVPEPAAPPPPVPEENPSDSDAESQPADPAVEAQELFESGREVEALRLLRRASAAAPTGRERFHCDLHLAELCLRAGRPQIAQPLLEDLAGRVERFHLEDWETSATCARVWAALYECLRATAQDDGTARLRQIYARLCRLDLDRALSLE